MKIGYSLLLGEYINAEGINYTDCKNFQIVCPSCKEPVFKAKRELNSSTSHYLSHYNKDKSYADECELRVSKISQKDIQSLNNEARNQKLEYFLNVLKDTILEHEYDQGESLELSILLLKKIGNSAAIQFFRDKVYEITKEMVRESGRSKIYDLFDSYIDDIVEVAGSFYETSFSIEIQKRIAYDILSHLVSAKARGNYIFLFSHSYVTLMNRIEKIKGVRDFYDYEIILHQNMRKLIGLSKSKGLKIFNRLANYTLRPPHTIESSNLLNKMASEIAHEMLGCIIRLPYFEMIKKAGMGK